MGYCFAIPSGSISNENTFSYISNDIAERSSLAIRAGNSCFFASFFEERTFMDPSMLLRETFSTVFDSCHFFFFSCFLATMMLCSVFEWRYSRCEWLDKVDERWSRAESLMVIRLHSPWRLRMTFIFLFLCHSWQLLVGLSLVSICHFSLPLDGCQIHHKFLIVVSLSNPELFMGAEKRKRDLTSRT